MIASREYGHFDSGYVQGIVVAWLGPAALANSLETVGEELEKTIWLSYDLGATGDYEGMYSWLDENGAKECGSSVAFLKSYGFKDDLLTQLEADIGEAVELNRRSRIYVIFSEDGHIRGRYLVGRRKAPPWTGFGEVSEQEFDED